MSNRHALLATWTAKSRPLTTNTHKMINATRSKQNWSVGSTVKIGFLTLTVIDIIPTPGDSMPDEYRLISASGKRYAFVPHHGLERI